MARTSRLPFSAWMRAVDAAVTKKCGLSADDLPDACYCDWHAQGVSPSAAAARAIRAAKDY
jgi:hypothetical protein